MTPELAAAIQERLGLMGIYGQPTPEQLAEAERCARRTEDPAWIEEVQRSSGRPRSRPVPPPLHGVQGSLFGG